MNTKTESELTVEKRFGLDESLDPLILRRLFQKRDRVRASRFLRPELAASLSAYLSNEKEWGISLACGAIGRRFSPQATSAKLTALQRRDIFEAAYADCGQMYSHLYECISLTSYHDKASESGRCFGLFLEFVNSKEFMSFIREVTGIHAIEKATAVACRYSHGHFYASHRDQNGGNGHRASYVLNLSARWEPQWGGLLQFAGKRGEIVDAYIPTFNSISIFRADKTHAVSLVSPCAAFPRLSIAGALTE